MRTVLPLTVGIRDSAVQSVCRVQECGEPCVQRRGYVVRIGVQMVPVDFDTAGLVELGCVVGD